ncbi:hypothetical protein ACSBR2_036110 [Camellia fascicularis]
MSSTQIISMFKPKGLSVQDMVALVLVSDRQNLQKGLGLLASDHMLMSNPRTKQYVDLYAANQATFFNDFARAMEKVGV